MQIYKATSELSLHRIEHLSIRIYFKIKFERKEAPEYDELVLNIPCAT